MPSGNVDKPVIEDNRDGTVSVRYDPREEGLHELAVKFNGEHVQGNFSFANPFIDISRFYALATHADSFLVLQFKVLLR